MHLEPHMANEPPTPVLDEADIVAVYDELRHIAGALLRGRQAPPEISRPTVLVIRWIEKLNANKGWTFRDLASRRPDIIRMAGISMRRLLINLWAEQQRRKSAVGCPVAFEAVMLNEDGVQRGVPILDLEKFDLAMASMHAEAPDAAQVAEQVLFLGMKQSEIALALDTTPKAVEHRWAAARSWLRARLDQHS